MCENVNEKWCFFLLFSYVFRSEDVAFKMKQRKYFLCLLFHDIDFVKLLQIGRRSRCDLGEKFNFKGSKKKMAHLCFFPYGLKKGLRKAWRGPFFKIFDRKETSQLFTLKIAKNDQFWGRTATKLNQITCNPPKFLYYNIF